VREVFLWGFSSPRNDGFDGCVNMATEQGSIGAPVSPVTVSILTRGSVRFLSCFPALVASLVVFRFRFAGGEVGNLVSVGPRAKLGLVVWLHGKCKCCAVRTMRVKDIFRSVSMVRGSVSCRPGDAPYRQVCLFRTTCLIALCDFTSTRMPSREILL